MTKKKPKPQNPFEHARGPRPKRSTRFYQNHNVIEQFTQGEKVGAILGDGDWEHGTVLNPLNSLPDIAVLFPDGRVELLLKRDVRKI